MNTDTGHLITKEELERQANLLKGLYEQVPDELNNVAILELAGRKECYVGKQSTGSVNTWAEKQRAKKKANKKARKLCCS